MARERADEGEEGASETSCSSVGVMGMLFRGVRRMVREDKGEEDNV
jgi:hypothetical protein